jgi:tripartite-type tricarboxylate transporter receptor subunit TctC
MDGRSDDRACSGRTMIGRRNLLIAMAALGLVAATQAQAQSYPSRPVKIIVPTVAGGTVDVITRLIANDLSSRLGVSFIVDNRSGAGNTLGTREAARADPDGSTLLMSSASGQVISPLVYKAVDYDPIRSFAPIGLVAEGSIILVVNPSLPFKSVAEFVAQAKTHPGTLNYGSAGTGTVPHLTGELFKSAAGIDLVHVPYRGGALSIADVIGGNVQMTFEASSPLLPHIRDARLRALAVMSKVRIPDLPDVPSAAESGYPDLVVTTWTGLFAPAGTDAAIVGKLNGALNEGLRSPALQSALAKVGNLPLGGPPAALTQMIVTEKEKWTPIVKALNLKAE